LIFCSAERARSASRCAEQKIKDQLSVIESEQRAFSRAQGEAARAQGLADSVKKSNADLERSNAQLERLLGEERARAKRLEEERKKIGTKLK
jgi:hypothetical protein